MKITKKPTLSIYIPAYNEEENIFFLLKSLVSQESKGYKLEKIVVVDDGSSDNTKEKVKNISENYPVVEIISDGKRLGKIERLNQIYKQNKSDIAVIFDGDVLPMNNTILDKAVEKFDADDVALVGFDKFPIFPTNFVGKLIYHWYKIVYEVRRDVKDGDSIYNFSSCAYAIKKDFALKMYYPKDVYPITRITFFEAITENLKVRFAKGVGVYFKLPDNISDYLDQLKRFSGTKEMNISFYGKDLYSFSTKIPLRKKISGILNYLKKHPFYGSLSILFRIYVSLIPYKTHKYQIVTWKSIKSTKKLI